MIHLLVAGMPGTRRVAVCVSGRIVEYHVESADDNTIGGIHLGRVMRVNRGLPAAYVDVGLARPGFLPLPETTGKVAEGDAVIVQITRPAESDKGPRLTARPALPGRWMVLRPGGGGIASTDRSGRDAAGDEALAIVRGLAAKGEGISLRGAATADMSALRAELDRLRSLWRVILETAKTARPPRCLHRDDDLVVRIARDRCDGVVEIVFEHRTALEDARTAADAIMPDLSARMIHRPMREWMPGPGEIEDRIDAALEPTVPLPGGGFLIVDEGEALTAFDVNTGGGEGNVQREGGRPILEANLEAARTIADEVRLRNIGGIVVVDFVNMTGRADRNRVVEALGGALAGDPTPTRIGTMTSLGLVELTRQRRGPTLRDMLMRPCPNCGRRGYVRRADGEEIMPRRNP
jgi:Rne/Rng family ribonuclease